MSNLPNSYIYTFISSQIPEHIRNDYDLYETFLVAYYEWLCKEGNALYATSNISQFMDIDNAPEYFYTYLKNEILAEFPDNVLADKRLLLRYAKDFYERKGTESSYEFLFKVLYNDNISIKYPGDNILKSSDGKWVVDHIIYVKSIQGDPYELTSSPIYTENNDTLYVDNVILLREGKYEVYKLTLTNSPVMEFDIGAKLYNADKTIVIETYGVIKNIEIINGGNGYNIGDLVPITDLSGQGINAVAMISNTKADNKINGFDIINGGENYRVGDQLVFIPVNGGSGASAYVSEINVENVSSQCITTLETEQNVILDTVKNIKIIDYIKFQDFQIGSIKKIKLVSGGYGYKTMPYIQIHQTKLYDLPEGNGAIIQAKSDSSGQITEIKILNRGIGYTNADTINIDLSQLGNGQAIAKANIYGGIISSDGYWLNNDGKLDSTVYLQDNKYYQNFSYVIESCESIKDYKDVVTNMVHPAGTQMYGELSINNEVDVGYGFDASCDKELIIHIQKEMICQMEDLIKNMIIHIEKGLNAADIYGYEYFISDYKDEYISNYKNLVLHDFVAIYQDLLLYDIQYLELEQIWDAPLNTLYGCSRPTVDAAQVAIIKSDNLT